jgi:hypothetical protein
MTRKLCSSRCLGPGAGLPDTPTPPHPHTPTHPPTSAVLEWRVHLARGQPLQVAGVALGIVGSGALALSLFGSLPLALLVSIALFGATSEFLLPIQYRLTPEAAELRNGLARRRMAWTEVRKAYLAEDGIKLSPLDYPSRLEAYRGLFLRFADNREAVVAAVRHFRAAAALPAPQSAEEEAKPAGERDADVDGGAER